MKNLLILTLLFAAAYAKDITFSIIDSPNSGSVGFNIQNNTNNTITMNSIKFSSQLGTCLEKNNVKLPGKSLSKIGDIDKNKCFNLSKEYAFSGMIEAPAEVSTVTQFIKKIAAKQEVNYTIGNRPNNLRKTYRRDYLLFIKYPCAESAPSSVVY